MFGRARAPYVGYALPQPWIVKRGVDETFTANDFLVRRPPWGTQSNSQLPQPTRVKQMKTPSSQKGERRREHNIIPFLACAQICANDWLLTQWRRIRLSR